MVIAASGGEIQLSPAPSVGIILTTYNGREFIEEQLDSLLAQKGVSVHIYAFDDSSSDETPSILRSYADRHPGTFSIFENAANSGGTGLNILRNVHHIPPCHDYVALADQDDLWLPEKLASAIASLKWHEASLYFSNLVAWDGRQEIGIVEKAAAPRARDHLFGGGSAGCTYVMAKDFFAHFQGILAEVDFSGVRRVSHDWLIYFFARHFGYRVCASTDALIKYRIHSASQYGGMTQGGLAAIRRKCRMLRAGFMQEQIDNALRIARDGTEDRLILLACKKGRCHRVAILAKYRFSLARSRSRFFTLAVALLVFR